MDRQTLTLLDLSVDLLICSPEMSGRGAVEMLDTLDIWRPLLADLAPRLSALAARGARLAL